MAVFPSLFHVYIPRRVRLFERISLNLAGKADGKDGTISQDDDGYYRSQFLATVRSEGQRAVDTNVTATGRELGGIQRRLEEKHSEYNNLLSRLDDISLLREAAVADASAKRVGDEGAADGTLERRKARRVQQATTHIDSEQAMVYQRLCDVSNEVAEMLDVYREILFLCRQRISLIQERYQTTCHIYLRAAHMDDACGVRSLDERVIQAAIDSFNARVSKYDFARHLRHSVLAA